MLERLQSEYDMLTAYNNLNAQFMLSKEYDAMDIEQQFDVTLSVAAMNLYLTILKRRIDRLKE